MMMRIQRFFSFVPAVILLVFMTTGFASAEITMSLGSSWDWPGQTVEIPIKVNAPESIAGAAFTITYDSTNLSLDKVESIFFDTFANQWDSLTPAPAERPPESVDVGGTVYTQPLVTNTITGGMRVAAARCMPAASTEDPTLFTLTFSLKTDAPPGKYAVDVVATVLDNVDAGYDEDGEAIDLIIGADLSKEPSDSGAFPVLLSKTADPEAGYVTFEEDSDKDNMGDFWEKEFFTTIGAKDGTLDSDEDGYSDFQEFANGTNPYVQDPKDGDGYDKSTDNRVGISIQGAIMILLGD